MKTFSFESIGTKWQIDLQDDISQKNFHDLKGEIFSFLYEFDDTYSRFKDKSLISKISKKEGLYKFPKSSKELFSIYHKLYELTDGRFTLLIGKTLESAGYDKNYSLKPKKIQKSDDWSAINFKFPFLKTRKQVLLDFGACGKGYAIDQIRKILEKRNIRSFIVDAGGDLYIKKIQNSKIGLENPYNSTQIIGIANVNNASICASALNRRKWDKYSHIIDPKTLKSPDKIAATWVISKNAVVADAIATALFLVRPTRLKNEFDFEYLILYSDFKAEKSQGFKAEIYYN